MGNAELPSEVGNVLVTGAKADRPVTLHKKLQVTENKTISRRYLNSNM